MRQIPLPLGTAREADRIVLGASLQPMLDALAAPAGWPFGTAVLSGPPRSGKSLLARWFAASHPGAEVIDPADGLAEDALFHRWNRAQADTKPLLLVSGRAPGSWQIALPDLRSRLGAALHIEIPAPDDELLTGLIEDRLRLAAAEAAGIVIDAAAVQAGMEEFASRANLTAAKLIEALAPGGVEAETFRDFVEAGVT